MRFYHWRVLERLKKMYGSWFRKICIKNFDQKFLFFFHWHVLFYKILITFALSFLRMEIKWMWLDNRLYWCVSLNSCCFNFIRIVKKKNRMLNKILNALKKLVANDWFTEFWLPGLLSGYSLRPMKFFKVIGVLPGDRLKSQIRLLVQSYFVDIFMSPVPYPWGQTRTVLRVFRMLNNEGVCSTLARQKTVDTSNILTALFLFSKKW